MVDPEGRADEESKHTCRKHTHHGFDILLTRPGWVGRATRGFLSGRLLCSSTIWQLFKVFYNRLSALVGRLCKSEGESIGRIFRSVQKQPWVPGAVWCHHTWWLLSAHSLFRARLLSFIERSQKSSPHILLNAFIERIVPRFNDPQTPRRRLNIE